MSLASWRWLNTCLPMGSSEWIPYFALLVCAAFVFAIKLSLYQPTSFHTFTLLIFSPILLWGVSKWLCGAVLSTGAKPQQLYSPLWFTVLWDILKTSSLQAVRCSYPSALTCEWFLKGQPCYCQPNIKVPSYLVLSALYLCWMDKQRQHPSKILGGGVSFTSEDLVQILANHEWHDCISISGGKLLWRAGGKWKLMLVIWMDPFIILLTYKINFGIRLCDLDPQITPNESEKIVLIYFCLNSCPKYIF